MRVYVQSSGFLYLDDALEALCYSGSGASKNEPADQALVGLGPIPCGAYTIGEPSDDPAHGPLALHLVPLPGTDTLGRSGFLMHGDSIATPGAASHGCIIAPRVVRERAFAGQDKLLVVISGNF